MEEQAPETLSTNAEEPKTITMAEFLETVPPTQEFVVSDISRFNYLIGNKWFVNTPVIQLHCTDTMCNGLRFFRSRTTPIEVEDNCSKFIYLQYRCSNCQRTVKTFSISVLKEAGTDRGKCLKFGELPPFGPPISARLITLIGPDRDLFLKGRRCENQGLGIGAFVYYRRVVENQKNRIISQILNVARKLNVGAEAIAELEAAIAETQFSKALSSVKKGIPSSLLINGHNPLLLLHSALSEGLHDRDDQECLQIAATVRLVLIDLSDRLAQALRDEAELNHAISRLMSRGDKRG